MLRQFTIEAPTRAETGATNVYLLGDEDGLLVDPAGRSQALDEAVASGASAVAVTHFHPDHVGALDAYAEEYDLTVWTLTGRTAAFESATGRRPDRTFAPGDRLPVAGGVEVVDTPGHASEHVAYRIDEGLLTGDLLLASGSVVVGGDGGDMRAYLSSLRRLYARDPARLYPGHGVVVEDPRAVCERLLRHRLERERRVLQAVEAGNQTPNEIVEAAYDKDVSAVLDLARATVIAHVEKLAIEGKVAWDGDCARPRH